jgi:NitT/TauT family transport system substrate-binding protein
MRGIRIVAAVLLVSLAGCQSSDSDEDTSAGGNSGRPVTIKVGDVEGTPASFLTFGVQKGFFTGHGLNVQVATQQGGAAIVPGLVSGDLQIGGSNVVSIFLARSRNLSVKIIAPGTSVGTDPAKDFSAVVVAGDSPIRSGRDLAGKTIGVNTLKNVNDVVIKSYLEAQGADASSVKFTELPFPAMLPAITQHRVDAALVIEPFATTAQNQGARVLFRPYVEAKPNLAIGTYSAAEKYIQENPNVVKSFQEGLAETAKYVGEHPDEFRTALTTIAKVAPDLAAKVNLPVWRPQMDKESLEFFADRMVRYGLVTTKPDVAAALG